MRRSFTMCWMVLAAATLAACRSESQVAGPPTAATRASLSDPMRVLNVVAHEDDDLLFLNPDLQNDIERGATVRTVFVTAGPQWAYYYQKPGGALIYSPTRPDWVTSDSQIVADWVVREHAILAAYARMARVTGPGGPLDLWNAGTLTAGGYNVRVFSLKSAPQISVVFLRLSCGIQDLWYGVIPTLGIVNYGELSEIRGYGGDLLVSKVQLAALLHDLLVGFAPQQLRTTDAMQQSGFEHEEHVAAARLLNAANALLPTPLPITLYRGYNVAGSPANLPTLAANAKTASFAAYTEVDTKQYGPTFIASSPSSIEVSSLSRRYTASQLGTPLRFGDINGDGLIDVCTRWSDGPHCALKQAGSAGFLNLAAAPYRAVANFSDPSGWGPAQYASTLQLADVNGDGRADLCGRAGAGILCAPSAGTSFGGEVYWSSSFSDADGWDAQPSRYGSIRFGDIDGDGRADVCGRSPAGIVCARSNGSAFESAVLRIADFTDAQGWAAVQYGSTLQLGDVNGDGRADVCGRGGVGIFCAIAQAGGGFDSATLWTSGFSDAQGWNATPAYYGSIRLVDVNGDGKQDVCGRGPSGFQCARSTGSGFASPNQVTADFVHALAWVGPQAGPPVEYTDVYFDGSPASCPLTEHGFVCAGP